MPYMMGLLEGFQQRRDEEYKRNLELDLGQREREGRIYQHLLQSRDPEIQAMALSGLFESARPGSRKKGLRGYLGEVEGSQTYPQILALMNQMVPPAAGADRGMGGPPPAPGSAAMPGNTPVRPGSQPVQVGANPSGEMETIQGAPFVPGTGELGMGGDAALAGAGNSAGGQGTLGPPPIPNLSNLVPESRWKRRGTGIPTAEEIAEQTEIRRARAKDDELIRTLTMVGASPEEIRAGILASHGMPQARGRVILGPQVMIPGATGPQQTIIRDGVLYMEDGETPVPAGYQVVPKPTAARAGGSGAAGQTSSVMEDNPRNRAWLMSLPGGELLASMPPQTGGIRVRRGPDGRVTGVLPAMQTAPLQTGGRITRINPDTGLEEIVNLDRAGNPTGSPGAPVRVEVQERTRQAKAILDRLKRWETAENQKRRIAFRPSVTVEELDAEMRSQFPRSPFQSYEEMATEAQRGAALKSSVPEESFGQRLDKEIENIMRERGGGPPAPPRR